MEKSARTLGLPVLRRAKAQAGEDRPPHDLQQLCSPELDSRRFAAPLVPGNIGGCTSRRRIWPVVETLVKDLKLSAA